MAKLSRGAGGAAANVAVGQELARRDPDDHPPGDVATAAVSCSTTPDSRTQGSTRRVDALRVESIDTDWYLRALGPRPRGAAHVPPRPDVRASRVDDRAGERSIDDVDMPDTLFQQSATDVIVTVELDASSLPLVADFLADTADAPDGGGRVRVRLAASAGFDGVVRLVAGLPGRAVVIDPPAAREAVREFAESALRGH